MSKEAELVATVVIPTYNGRDRIGPTLRALDCQDLHEPYEIVIVDSGETAIEPPTLSAAEVQVIRSSVRLRPGPARNAGLRAARGQFVAFCPDDGIPATGWLSARLEKHREGYDAVGGAITNGTPSSSVGTAGYLLEYSAMLPVEALLAEQEIPHALSFHRSVFDRLGAYPEDVVTGEDTLFNKRYLAAGLRVGFAPGAAIAHHNPTTVRQMVTHAKQHGHGLMQCVARHRLGSSVGHLEQPVWRAALRMLVLYPARGWTAKVRRLYRYAPGLLPRFFRLSPLICLGMAATGWGAWSEWRSARDAPVNAPRPAASRPRR